MIAFEKGVWRTKLPPRLRDPTNLGHPRKVLRNTPLENNSDGFEGDAMAIVSLGPFFKYFLNNMQLFKKKKKPENYKVY